MEMMRQIMEQKVDARRIGPILAPDRSRVLIQPFHPTCTAIALKIIARVMALPEERVGLVLRWVLGEFGDRHEQIEKLLLQRFSKGDVPAL